MRKENRYCGKISQHPNSSGAPKEGRLNEHGQAGLYEIEPGSCKITFPDLDKDAWD